MSGVLVRQATYDLSRIRAVVSEMLSTPAAPCITPGCKVLLKPNFLQPASPDQAITTHPLVLRAVAECVLEKGAHVQISDSPAIGGFSRILKKGGYEPELAGLAVTVVPFEQTVPVDLGPPFGKVRMARDAMEADVVINLAKLKTHSQMGLTLGVKNIFGCVVGLEKPEWHMRAGVDRHLFARLIVSLYEAVKPAYTLVDGILAMEGQGPGKSGTPRELGLLFGGDNAHAVDHAICLLAGMPPARLETHSNALEMGVYDGNVHIDGQMKILADFDLPVMGELTMGPAFLNRFMRRFVLQRPVANRDRCRLCGECWTYCPVHAITTTNKGIVFDTAACIRCYCCLEVCPHAAILAKTPLAGDIITGVRTWFRETALKKSPAN
ncbi:DUF362 domain-containing protein [Desulfosarcina sp. OttesenSCG-928-B08]|nr:DUF362 domain-containing protein [Desulfosarcina sp. OttesenSCG-928-B08]